MQTIRVYNESDIILPQASVEVVYNLDYQKFDHASKTMHFLNYGHGNVVKHETYYRLYFNDDDTSLRKYEVTITISKYMGGQIDKTISLIDHEEELFYSGASILSDKVVNERLENKLNSIIEMIDALD